MRILFLFLAVFAATAHAQSSPKQQQPELSPAVATELAGLMCRQIPNAARVFENTILVEPGDIKPHPPAEEPITMDDVYTALMDLGPYSVPCLTDQVGNGEWMPDPRTEPLEGMPHVGDVAYLILTSKGVENQFSKLATRQPANMDGMYFYYWWPTIGDHRARLQAAVRNWIAKHPKCCGEPPFVRSTAPTEMKFRMSPAAFAKAQTAFSRLKPGMDPKTVLSITGPPDAIDPGEDSVDDHLKYNLLSLRSSARNENLAYIYFVERWTNDIARRDPLRDRYVIAFFSEENKLTRVFSNNAAIPPIFPHSRTEWEKLMWGETTASIQAKEAAKNASHRK